MNTSVCLLCTGVSAHPMHGQSEIEPIQGATSIFFLKFQLLYISVTLNTNG